MKKLCITIICLFILVIGLYSEDDRGVKIAVDNLGGNSRAGKQYLILIAIDAYQYWFSLKHPVKDAKEIRDILISRYYIDEVIELYNKNATKANILKLFDKFKDDIKVEDSLLIFYAGHGHLDKNTDTGFWIPVNGGTDIYEQANWLPNTQIRGMISNMKASHICLISDSCFSGDILNSSRGMAPEINNEYFKKAYERTSRQVLTAGSSETVPDKSEFARQLKMTLEKNNNPYLDPMMLYNQIRLGVGKTLPLIGSLKSTGHQDGASFLLFLKQEKTADKSKIVKEDIREEEMDITIIKNYGSLKINVVSAGKLHIDGDYKADIPEGSSVKIDKIETGVHTFKMTYKGNNKEEKKIRIERDKIMEVSFVWKEKLPSDDVSYGNIKVVVATGGQLYIDDKYNKTLHEMGEHIISNIETGTHKVEMRYEVGENEAKTVIVEEDKIAKVKFNTIIDNFENPVLDSEWSWIREKEWQWSLSENPGWLTITSDDGDLWERTNNQRNLLLGKPEQNDFTIETKIEFYPSQNYQQAGLIIYQDDDNYVRLFRQFSNEQFVSFQKEDNAKPYSTGIEYKNNIFYLRIVKKGNKYTGYISNDGKNFTRVAYLFINLGGEPSVGLAMNKGLRETNTIQAHFDYFRITYED